MLMDIIMPAFFIMFGTSAIVLVYTLIFCMLADNKRLKNTPQNRDIICDPSTPILRATGMVDPSLINHCMVDNCSCGRNKGNG